MNSETLIDAIKAAPKKSDEIKAIAIEVIKKHWGPREASPALRKSIEMAVCKAEQEGDKEAIYADLKLFLSKQKQNQNLSPDLNL